MHTSRFTKAGDYFRIDIAGYPIILIQEKDGMIQAFHNVCRHRAYPIVSKDSGSSLVLGTIFPSNYIYALVTPILFRRMQIPWMVVRHERKLDQSARLRERS
jgi:hypothetical protein